jgi:hypothetical protein
MNFSFFKNKYSNWIGSILCFVYALVSLPGIIMFFFPYNIIGEGMAYFITFLFDDHIGWSTAIVTLLPFFHVMFLSEFYGMHYENIFKNYALSWFSIVPFTLVFLYFFGYFFEKSIKFVFLRFLKLFSRV